MIISERSLSLEIIDFGLFLVASMYDFILSRIIFRKLYFEFKIKYKDCLCLDNNS